MPEIIRFSNDLCYSDQPLIPLRQYGPGRLKPLEHVFVEGGYREGDNNRALNRPEANALVDKIVELCNDKRYDGKTILWLQLWMQMATSERGQRMNNDTMWRQAEREIRCGSFIP